MKEKLKITEVEITKIKPYENNPRNNEEAVDYVAESIQNFGFKVPLIIDKNYVIVSGHTRYKAALNLNMDTVPCIITSDLTQKQIKAFRIADNKVSEYSKWDNELLKEELEELSNLDFDIESIGFQDWELEQILNPLLDEDINDFFVEKDPKEKEKKLIKCPLCGGKFEQ